MEKEIYYRIGLHIALLKSRVMDEIEADHKGIVYKKVKEIFKELDKIKEMCNEENE